MTATTEHAAVVGLHEVDASDRALVGGKGAQLGAVARIDGVRVPPGFCVTTAVFRAIVRAAGVEDRLDELARLGVEDRDGIRACSAEIRAALEAVPIPADVAVAITAALASLGDRAAVAVRSSATAEDLPTASFAGQQDSFLDVVGPAAVLAHVSRCWASLFTDRAVTYRLRNGIDHRRVQMAVVVQRMVAPHAAGVLFTADPVTSNRTVATVEAAFGLGEALVSGHVDPDAYRVRDGEIVSRTVAGARPALTDAQVVRLAQLGRRIEAHLGRPQDIEWCLDGDGVQIVQSRPITTLFPIPAAPDDAPRVYLSVGHQQMMTDAMRPLGLSLFQLLALPPMHEAGGRLFVEVTQRLASPAARSALLGMIAPADPLTGDALRTIVERGFVPSVPDPAPAAGPPPGAPDPIETDPAIVTELIERNRASNAALARAIRATSGPQRLELILTDVAELKRILFDPRGHQVFMGAMDASAWLNEHLERWLGDKNVADSLTQSVPNNVTSEMGLALLDVADAIRPHPQVVAALEHARDDTVLDALGGLPGGPQALVAIDGFLARYGMRCVGEIDITRPRWSERPSALFPVILANVASFEPGAAKRRFAQGREQARAKEAEVLERLRALPDGEAKAAETTAMIDRVRTFMGYREHPKYFLVGRTAIYKRALLEEAERLAQSGAIAAAEDVFFLTFGELQDAVRTQRVDAELIAARKDAFAADEGLTPPRVLTSEGEVLTGTYRRDDVPAGALTGLPVSTGTVEGRARVVSDVADADLAPGDILVTAFTDPSWTPLFVAIGGLVTEVGGLMTHGAVIAREYGLPAIVAVPEATTRIRDGQRIRVHGTDGYVELLS